MLGRSLAALLLVMLVALAGTALEKHNREQLRQISLQTYRWQVLQREYARARLMAETEGAPARMLERLGQTPAQLPGTAPRAAIAETLADHQSLDQPVLDPQPLDTDEGLPGGVARGEVPSPDRLSLDVPDEDVADPAAGPASDRVAGRERVEPGD
jgi:hypothetical protein